MGERITPDRIEIPLSNRWYVMMGRDTKRCDVCLKHHTASKLHAQMYYTPDDGVFIMDLWTTHGTFINGEKMTPRKFTVWQPGQKYKFGKCPDEWTLATP